MKQIELTRNHLQHNVVRNESACSYDLLRDSSNLSPTENASDQLSFSVTQNTTYFSAICCLNISPVDSDTISYFLTSLAESVPFPAPGLPNMSILTNLLSAPFPFSAVILSRAFLSENVIAF